EQIGQSIRVHFEADRQSGPRTHSPSHAAVLRAGDGLVQLQGTAEEGLGAEGIEAKDLPAFLDRPSRVCIDQAIVRGKLVLGRPRPGASFFPGVDPEPGEKRDTEQEKTHNGRNGFMSHVRSFLKMFDLSAGLLRNSRASLRLAFTGS